MVNEREPPRAASGQYKVPQQQFSGPATIGGVQNQPRPLHTITAAAEAPRVPLAQVSPPQKQLHELLQSAQQPEFGKASPLRNPFRADTSHLFIPKANTTKPRSNHTTSATFVAPRPVPPPAPFTNNQQFKQPPASPSPDVIEIPRPNNPPTRTIQPAPRPQFSSLGTHTTFQAINDYNKPRVTIDLTSKTDEFDPDAALRDDKFGASDPYAFVDTAQASENIKALLEGAFDDEDDKPKTRLRKRNVKKEQDAAKGLAEKLAALEMKNEEKREIEDEEEEDDDGTVEGLSVQLLPHQVEGVAWMIDKEVGERKKNGVLPKGGILADDMGLGKTIQSVALILTNPRPPLDAAGDDSKHKSPPKDIGKGTLVVAPLALIKQWEAEIKSKVTKPHSLRVLVHHGPSRTKSFNELKKYDVVITTYQILASEHAGTSDAPDGIKVGCFGVHWCRVILDEAHTIKNRNAKSTQACYALKALYRWCLTGTPMQNNLDELQSLIHFLRIKPYDELRQWKDQITGPMKNGRGGLAMKRLQYFLKAFMKRRTKDVLKKEGALNAGGKGKNRETKSSEFKIVDRKIIPVVAEFNAEERRFYDRLQSRAESRLEEMMGGEKQNYIGALVLLLRLRQACNHPQLIGGNVGKDKDALATGTTGSGSQTPRKAKKEMDDDLDDVASMLGGLSVATKLCDVCQVELYPPEVAKGAIRKDKKLKVKKEKRSERKVKPESNKVWRSNKMRHRKIITDSDDEEGDGDWVVPKAQQDVSDLGIAGGTDDENAEGGGDWLRSEDSETGEEEDNENSSENEEEEDASSSDDESTADGLVSSTKIRHLVQILNKETDDHKVIVFSQFTSMLDLIEPFLRNEGFVFTRYDGSMRNDLREASLERLRNDKKTRILLCSLKCGSLGLNLTAASRVVILEPFWNPFVEEQAIDRVHRLNQTVDVVVYRLTVASTVEERILALQEKKRQLANAAIEGGKAVGKLSMKDIMQLFRRDAEHHHVEREDDLALGRTQRVLDVTSSPVKRTPPTGVGSAMFSTTARRFLSPSLTRSTPFRPSLALAPRSFHSSRRALYPSKDSQDKDSVVPKSTEYSKSGSDDASAATEDAAFDPNTTRPEQEQGQAEAESGGASNNPLEVSPANQEVSKARGEQEGGAGASKAESGQSSGREGASGGGSPTKNGGKKSG
ncbi:hypothetical protein B0A49_05315 [Cryomyces minteri]|uniref:Helicase ATP-binding domain-containing protein n=1 Tax=Cryomyces minteri TaxID=331657 RepID=A0A4U0X6W0_9PEZI|nr:hypothetical protein B0A49_05315 [Cryomyces minteri]